METAMELKAHYHNLLAANGWERNARRSRATHVTYTRGNKRSNQFHQVLVASYQGDDVLSLSLNGTYGEWELGRWTKLLKHVVKQPNDHDGDFAAHLSIATGKLV